MTALPCRSPHHASQRRARPSLALDQRRRRQQRQFVKAASNRQRYSANGLFPPPIGGSYYTESTLQLVATYDFDWWGKRRAAIAASLGELNASRAEYAQAEQTLAAAIAQSYFQSARRLGTPRQFAADA